MLDLSSPVVIDDVFLAFPASVIGKLIPEWDELPVEFREHRSGYEELSRYACFNSFTLKEDAFKEGIDLEAAERHLNAVVRSFEPKHEHKEAAIAYLLSLWIRS